MRAHAISALGRYVFEGEAATYEDWDGHDAEISPEDYVRVSDFLFRIAQDPEEALEARRYAIEALAFRTDDPDVLDLIEWAFQHRDRRLKVSALFAMARNGDPKWTDYILTELRSPDPEIQYEAVRASGELGLHEATDALIEIARSKGIRKPLRLLAIYALGETGDERAYPVLDRFSHSRDRDVREVAREAMEEWFTISAMEQMVEDEVDDYDDENPFAPTVEIEGLPDIWADSIGTFSRN